jgi:acetyl esterase/lipase
MTVRPEYAAMKISHPIVPKSIAALSLATILVGCESFATDGPARVPAPATGYLEMKLYDGDPPNLLSNAPAERVAGNGFIRNVSVPTIRRYPVDESKSTGVAFVVFPGGGYEFVDMETHATALAKRLGPLGFAVFGLKYRINGGSSNVERDSLLDANRAIRFVRSHAAEWGLAENRIGVISYSAGSDLDMRLVAGGFDLGKSTATDPVERKSSRPDFVASMCTWAHGNSTSPYQFTADTPPVYLCHAQDDPSAPIAVSRQIDQQLQALHIIEHLDIYPTGGHDGFHVGDPNAPNRNWPDNYLPWLRANSLIVANVGVTQETKTNKTFIDYFLPTPIVGSLTTNIWGAETVGPRDPKNGLEDETMKQWNYWDGKILKGPDGIITCFAAAGIRLAVMGHGMVRWQFMRRVPISADLIPTRACAGRTGIAVQAITCPPCN